MGRIRACREDDIPALVELRRRTFRVQRQTTPAALEEYFRDVFFRNPWRDDALPSLVYETREGRIVGFVGVVPRRMTFDGAPLRAVVSTQFMVAPEHRGVPGVQLVQRLFAGPQDLTIGDAAPDSARKIWEGFGGCTALLHSFFWTRPLRRWRYAASTWASQQPGRVLGVLLRPVLGLADAITGRLNRRGLYHYPALRGRLETLQPEQLIAALPYVLERRRLRPDYDVTSLTWLLRHAEAAPNRGELRQALVRDDEDREVGWFMYYANRGGIGPVVQIAAREERAALVVSHLFRDAWNRGVIGLHGRLDPPLLKQLGARPATLGRTGPWVLIHSGRADVRRAFFEGNAWLSGLDGERWMLF